MSQFEHFDLDEAPVSCHKHSGESSMAQSELVLLLFSLKHRRFPKAKVLCLGLGCGRGEAKVLFRCLYPMFG